MGKSVPLGGGSGGGVRDPLEAGTAITNWGPSVRLKHNSAEEQDVEAGLCRCCMTSMERKV